MAGEFRRVLQVTRHLVDSPVTGGLLTAPVRAISVYGMVMGLAATSGQLIGGVLIRSDLGGLGWRAIFWINVPFGVAALLACPRFVPESRAASAAG